MKTYQWTVWIKLSEEEWLDFDEIIKAGIEARKSNAKLKETEFIDTYED